MDELQRLIWIFGTWHSQLLKEILYGDYGRQMPFYFPLSHCLIQF